MSEFTKFYRIECEKADRRLAVMQAEAKKFSELEGLSDDDTSARIRLARELGYITGVLRGVLYELACEKAIESARCSSAPNAQSAV